MKNSLQAHINLAKLKLKEAKPTVKLFGLDYDGTLSDGENFKLPQVFGLAEKILNKNKSIAFITARAATAIKILVPPLKELIDGKNISFPNYIAGGNGTTLYKVAKDGLKEIYNHGLNLAEIKKAVDAWKKIYEKNSIMDNMLTLKGLETFRKFLQDDWEGYIPSDIIDICRPYDGKIFTEEAKVTFVLPQDKNLHKKLIAEVNSELSDGLNAVAGDETYVHITKKLHEDSKKVAIKKILELSNLNAKEVATFGDMPLDNDAGLLSLPFSFTNSQEFIKRKEKLEEPPYFLSYEGLSPVANIYKAIEYLITI
jgi:hydroxymethylpyrimidine pyrophosphatase-like HAD family hydrolase